MIGINNYFSITSEFADISKIPFNNDSVLLHADSHEERSLLGSGFETEHPSVILIDVQEVGRESVKLVALGWDREFNLRSDKDTYEFTKYFEAKSVYVDFTGLTHSVWAWIIRALLLRDLGSLWALYSEPLEYKFNESPLDGQMFDLSEKINGIAPLPGFAKLFDFSNANFIFMPLLGFEGVRLAHILENVQPTRTETFPVIGVPGFNYDFPFFTYQGNRLTLEREGIWRNYRYEKANCPYSIFVLGSHLLNEYPDQTLRIAPIGTKPHALGAVLLKLAFPDKVDLIYDHPIRKKGRTKGKAKTLSFWLNPFLEVIKRK